MRYAALSDVHGNLEALTAVLDALKTEAVDRILCLGDTIGYGADPSACLERLQAGGAVLVAGNHEWGAIGKLEMVWFHEAARAALLWTRDQLSVADLDLLRRLPLTATEGPCTLVHGSLMHPQRFEYLMDVAQVMETLSVCRTAFCLVGHTHRPGMVEYDRVARRFLCARLEGGVLDDVEVRQAETVYLINPGSVGQPRDGDPRAAFALIDTERGRVTFRRLAYDVAAAQQKIRRAGLPAVLADRLAVGR
jgi:diadenosine tetraphosphatase ApaH/serine/threonine PP2A family protein phosphatase